MFCGFVQSDIHEHRCNVCFFFHSDAIFLVDIMNDYEIAFRSVASLNVLLNSKSNPIMCPAKMLFLFACLCNFSIYFSSGYSLSRIPAPGHVYLSVVCDWRSRED